MVHVCPAHTKGFIQIGQLLIEKYQGVFCLKNIIFVYSNTLDFFRMKIE